MIGLLYIFQKCLLKWIHNLADFAYHTLEVAWLTLYTLVLTSHETFHCMKIVLVLHDRVSPISGKGNSNNSVPFFKHLLSFCCVTDTAITQAEWNLTWNSLWSSSLGSYTRPEHRTDRHNCVSSLFQKEWIVCYSLNGLLYCSLKASLPFGTSQLIARMVLP